MKYISLFPFAYTLISRINSLRDFAYLALTQIVPGIWIVYRFQDGDIFAAALFYAIGYIAFICVYELGYMANDVWDSHRTAGGRRRVKFSTGTEYILAFVAMRAAVWISIALWLPPQENITEWMSGFIALSIVFFVHNVIQGHAIRIATFSQLCIFRYIIPIIYGTGMSSMMDVLVICLLFYFPFRYLSYLDSKGVLVFPERKDKKFGILYIVTIAPVIFFIYFVSEKNIFLEMMLFYALIHLANLFVPSARKPNRRVE